MSKNIINVNNLRKYHEGLKANFIDPMQNQIDAFESGDRFLVEIDELKKSVNNNLVNINVNKSNINTIKTDINTLNNTVREIDEIKENTGMNFLDSLSALFVDHDEFQADRNSNGYIKLPGGLIIQWGVVPLEENSGTIDKFGSWAIPFPSHCLSHIVSVRGYDNNWDTIVSSYPINNKSFRVIARNKVASLWNAVYFISIGY